MEQRDMEQREIEPKQRDMEQEPTRPVIEAPLVLETDTLPLMPETESEVVEKVAVRSVPSTPFVHKSSRAVPVRYASTSDTPFERETAPNIRHRQGEKSGLPIDHAIVASKEDDQPRALTEAEETTPLHLYLSPSDTPSERETASQRKEETGPGDTIPVLHEMQLSLEPENSSE